MVIALLVPITLGVQFGALQVGIHIAIGAYFISPSDVSGSFRLKILGMLFSLGLVLGVTIIASFLKGSFWLTFFGMGVLVFAISYLSIYGFRASLISFCGLFALSLSSASFAESGFSLMERVIFIGIGGVWYMGLTYLRHKIFPSGPTEYYLSHTLKLTADYLDVRRKLMANEEDRDVLFPKLLAIQVELTETHETIRELLITSRKNAGLSTYAAKRMMVFSQLIDILELAMANPVDYNRTDQFFEDKPEVKENFQRLILAMSGAIRQLGLEFSKIDTPYGNDEVEIYLKELEIGLESLKSELDDEFDEDILLFSHLLSYQRNQVKKINKIAWAMKKPNPKELKRFKNRDYRRFLTEDDYKLNVLIDNFNFGSTIFRHSLRLALSVMVGIAIGSYLEVLNGYWITLTLIVILRPNYGLTKERFKHRTIGTLFGGGIGYIIILLTQNPVLISILSILGFVVGMSMVQRNYKTAAAFITMHVLFIYALLVPNALEFAQYRVIDTLIGAGIAAIANLLLLPAWEIKNIDRTLARVFKANKEYLEQIVLYYNKKGKLPHQYKVTRKEAFLALSDLNASFQRMAQEPKYQRKDIGKIYELSTLNNSILASLASISTYIISNPTTPASVSFNRVTEHIKENLELSENILKDKQTKISEDFFKEDILTSTYGKDISKLPLVNYSQTDMTKEDLKEEAFLIIEQLKWLLSMSKRIPKILEEVEFEG